MPDKLIEIMENTRREIAPRIRDVAEGELARLDASMPRPRPFAAALARADGRLAVIAEIKRRSPSAGEIARGASAAAQARAYRAAGADALSVLTDMKYFGAPWTTCAPWRRSFGKSRLARRASGRTSCCTPSRCSRRGQSGASAILIIVRALDDEEIRTLHGAARAAGLDALFEVHSEAEIERAHSHGARIIGVNNRDLAVFTTDLSLSERLIPRFPAGVIAVSESGINTAADAARVRAAGARAVLVGEAMMRAADPAGLVASLHGA